MPKTSTLGLSRENSGTYRLRLPNDLLAQWTAYAQEHQDTAPEALRTLMRHLMKTTPAPAKVTQPEVRTNNLAKVDRSPKRRIELRLTESEHAALTEIAEQSECSVQWWLVQLIRSVLTRGSLVNGAEMKLLGESNYQLSAIGRNLNQIAREINADPARNLGRLKAEQIEALTQQMKVHRERVHEVLLGCAERWELR